MNPQIILVGEDLISLTQSGIITENEARAMLGLFPKEKHRYSGQHSATEWCKTCGREH